MTNIEIVNSIAATLGVEVSVAPDGIGFDLYEIDSGVWLQTVDDLTEAEYELNNSYQEVKKPLQSEFYELYRGFLKTGGFGYGSKLYQRYLGLC